MKIELLTILLLVFQCSSLFAQNEFEPSKTNPFGLPNSNAPTALKDYQSMIGISDCLSFTRNTDGTWAEPIKMTWEFKYIMNGMAVQDQTLKDDGKHSGSIRQYLADSSQWFVHYYSSAAPATSLGTYKGGMVGNEIILTKNQKAPNGMDGKYKITFSQIRENGFHWLGEWVNLDETIKFPTWKIECEKRKTQNPS